MVTPEQNMALQKEMPRDVLSEMPAETLNVDFQTAVCLKVNLSEPGRTLENKFTDLNQWELGMDWLTTAGDQPEDYIRTNYPFVKRIQLMTSTGGTELRDLFLNPGDRGHLTDYNFTRLGDAVQNIIRQGLIPHIATGNVPLKYSSDPLIRAFGVNVRPPDDYSVYYDYIKALAQYMAGRFGLEEVRTWTWRALVEYENIDWFDAGDPQTTKEAYFKLYDYTVAALEEVVGAEHLYIGAHSMTNGEGYWDEREFIDHVAHGTNYYTGKKGTQLDFLTFSYYDHQTGVMSAYSLESNLQLLRDRAVVNGLTDLEYGVDEGRLMLGKDDKELFPRTVASGYQAASDARLFKHMHDIGLDYFSTWYLNTERIWGGTSGVDPVGTHVANLSCRMEGASRIPVQTITQAANEANEVDGIGAYREDSRTAHLLVYNFNPAGNATTGEPVTITFDNVKASQDGTLSVKQWLIDDEHANFWPEWRALLDEQGVADDDFGRWSSDSWTIRSIANSKIQRLWYANAEKYRGLASLMYTEETVEIKDGKLVLSHVLAPLGVVFYEITGIMPAAM
ncbi:GH39 family glycosyl hydrolase [Paenibacillus nasutitermitis]|uniref:Glycosyl hydrolases family 39 N-terminal catalytic domain-containing protein n=1 Tax=Paenibacillus nasutitermitis TaxID=1652958 RepID=A0A916ZFK8_9BACL|nr:hypothetical protein [Paenibacillus nasutitermitis]GGD93460.1 hypothetical protein GCM10010911_60110 [Paenibacillus nasutitermitis]